MPKPSPFFRAEFRNAPDFRGLVEATQSLRSGSCSARLVHADAGVVDCAHTGSFFAMQTSHARTPTRNRTPSRQRHEAQEAATVQPVRRRGASASDATRRVARRVTEPASPALPPLGIDPTIDNAANDFESEVDAQALRAATRTEIEEAVAAALAARLLDPSPEAAPATADATFEIDVEPAPEPGSESLIPTESITNARAAQLFPKPFAPLGVDNRKPSGTCHVTLRFRLFQHAMSIGMVWSCMVNAWLSTSTRARRRIRNGYNWEKNIANGFPGLRRYGFVRFGIGLNCNAGPLLRMRKAVAMTAKNVAEEASREAGRVRPAARPPPIDVDPSLAMDDVPE